MRFREHSGNLADSMPTVIELPDRAALIAHIQKLHDPFIGHSYDFSKIEVKPYFMRLDKRCGWDCTYIVNLPGYGVIGFTDGPLP